jgi:hypothetical protein
MAEPVAVRNPITKKKKKKIPVGGGLAGVGRAEPVAIRNPITKKKS